MRLEKFGFVMRERQRFDTRLHLMRVLIGRKERMWSKTSSRSATILAGEEETRILADLGALVLVLEQEDIALEWFWCLGVYRNEEDKRLLCWFIKRVKGCDVFCFQEDCGGSYCKVLLIKYSLGFVDFFDYSNMV